MRLRELVGSDEAIEDYTEENEDWYEKDASCEDSGYDDENDFITTESTERKSTSIDISPNILVDENYQSPIGQACASNPDDHLKILNTSLEHPANLKVFMDQLVIRYKRFVKEYVLQSVRNENLEAFNKDFLTLLEEKCVNLETLKDLAQKNAVTCPRFGI